LTSERYLPRAARLAAAALTLALGPLALPSCADDAAGIQVPVAYAGTALGASALTTADSARVRLTSARVGVDSVELDACPAPALADLTRALGALGLGVARAHSSSSPTRIGVPTVLDGLDPSQLLPGVFRPTPGSYCGLHGVLATPDQDALVAGAGEPLEGAVELHGERLGPDGQVLSTFTLVSTMTVSFDMAFEQPLVLDAEAPYAELTLVLDPATWVAAFELPEGPLSAEGARALSQTAAAALSLQLQRPLR
jgi:hypothetical protein